MDEEVDPGSLVERARSGDETAWATIYQLFYPRLAAYAQHRLANPHDGREAVSETMARAVVLLDRYRGHPDGLAPWLFGICRNVVSECQRRQRRFGGGEVEDRAADLPEPYDRLIAEEDYRAVRVAFARLDRQEQEILELRVVAELTSEQAAAALGMTAGAVRMAQARALARLRTFVEEGQRVG